MAVDNIFATQADLEQMIGSGQVTLFVLNKRLTAALEENAKLEAENAELKTKLSKKGS